jgi:hypothetical protein
MNIIEAVEAAKEGDHIRRTCWDYNTLVVYEGILYIYNNHLHKLEPHQKRAHMATFYAKDIEANDWEVVEE